MRHQNPLIIGAGPAGCAAAIALARAGARPLLIDRDEQVGDPICGGFLSWRTLARLQDLGVDCAALGAHEVRELRLFAGNEEARVPLPGRAVGLSRHALDSAMRRIAVAEGATLEIDRISKIEGTSAHGANRVWQSDALFLASGKHDVRGLARPRDAGDPALGVRLRIQPGKQLTRLLDGAIELHLFRGGYAGIVLQEDGSANICLALKKSLLSEAGGDPADLLALLAERSPHFAARLEGSEPDQRCDTIGAVPFGWIAKQGSPGLFRLGDQAAVIPSLAGEGISIALESAHQAVRFWQEGGASASMRYQPAFARKAARPIMTARTVRKLAEGRFGHAAPLWLARNFPGLLVQIMGWTRISSAS